MATWSSEDRGCDRYLEEGRCTNPFFEEVVRSSRRSLHRVHAALSRRTENEPGCCGDPRGNWRPQSDVAVRRPRYNRESRGSSCGVSEEGRSKRSAAKLNEPGLGPRAVVAREISGWLQKAKSLPLQKAPRNMI